MSVDDVIQFISEEARGPVPAENMLALVKTIYKLLGFTLSPDAALAITATPQYQLIIATAGAGKTTQTHIKLIIHKILESRRLGRAMMGKKILCLVYNDHNVYDMVNTHEKLVLKLKRSGIGGLEIDNEISAMTLHSFCHKWFKEYARLMGMPKAKLIKDGDPDGPIEILRKSYLAIAKRQDLKELTDYSELFKIYTYLNEKLLPYDSPETLDAFPGFALSPDILGIIFEAYDKMKKMLQKYDFLDMVKLTHQFMLENEAARTHMQNYYSYVLADEIQDFTPLMASMLRLIVGNNKPLVVVGDEDQSIYAFKGADIKSALNFTERFIGGEVYVFNYNRRCGSNIVEAANAIIGDNQLRYTKKILAVNEGGTVNMVGYDSDDGQLLRVVKELEAMTNEERANTVVAYRDKVFSSKLVDLLEERKIPFHTISGYAPFSHRLYRVVQQVMNILYDPLNIRSHVNLYKVLPIKKDDLYKIIGYDPGKDTFNTDESRKHFNKYDFRVNKEEANHNNEKLARLVGKLSELRFRVSDEPMKNYFPEVFSMIRKYYWDWLVDNGTNPAHDSEYTERVYNFFMSDKTYEALSQELHERVKVAQRMDAAREGVALSTFHSLKGLEYDNVYLLYLDDAIFPSVGQHYSLTAEKYQELKEGETRLMFVAMTRAKTNLQMYYPHRNPSYYIKLLQEYYAGKGLAVVERPMKDDVVKLTDVVKPVDKSGVSSNALSSTFLSNSFKGL